MYNDYFQSPLGLIEFKATEQGICQLIFCGQQTTSVKQNATTKACQQQLAGYFNRELTQFDLPLDMAGTAFQQQVWQQLRQISFGQSQTYQQLAKALNNPKAVRAVGAANGRNPITLIVPCHRVIGANGKLTGYAGGVERKAWLLQHEGIISESQFSGSELANVCEQRQQKTEFLR